MLFPNYIKKNHILIFISTEIILWLLGFVLLVKFLFLVFVMLLYLFRLKQLTNSGNSLAVIETSSIFSPSCGRIIEIVKKDQEIQILLQIPWHLSFAIYAPVMAVVEDIKTSHGPDLFRYSKIDDFHRESECRSLEVKLIMASNAQIKLKFIKCVFGLFPDIWVRQGDLCHQQAVIGVVPFGGTVSLSLPSNYEIIPKVGDMMTAGLSRMANIKHEV